MNHELPDRYGRTELVLMVVDPLLLFSYWEVTPESLRQAQHALGTEMEGARAVLRFYDISLIHFDGTNAHHTFDIDIGLEARNWYVHLWTAEKSYCADLGFVARTGRFHAITRANVVHTPPPDRKGTRLNSSNGSIWYAVFCLKKKNTDK